MDSTIAAFYHGDMRASERNNVQKQFTDGKLRIVVATIAFGMGLNKRNIRAIIHYDLPKSFESFVQEVGRAGRDGKQAYCHVFIDKKVSAYLLTTVALAILILYSRNKISMTFEVMLMATQ